MATHNSNNRASLLAGLRTGGVRSSSLNVPHTAALAGSFNISRSPSHHLQNNNSYTDDDSFDFQNDLPQQPLNPLHHHPMTAAVDGPHNRFAAQQGLNRPMNPASVPFSPGFPQNLNPQAQAQMQMLQFEMLRIQAIQNQQYQLAQAQQIQQLQQLQLQQQQQFQPQPRASANYNPPATAGPAANAFDLRSATLSAQMRRANQADHLRSQLGVRNTSPDHVPMTAALGGKFGSRSVSLNGQAHQQDDFIEGHISTSSSSTTVISGGTSLGSPASNNPSPSVVPSKSDSVSSWRRGPSVPRIVSSPSVRVTPPPKDDAPISSPVSAGPRFRPQPLKFSPAPSGTLPVVAVDNTDEDTDGETQSSGSSVKSAASNSSPTTPRSSDSNETPLSPREEASKRLFEGLGINRPVSATPCDQPTPQQLPTVSVNIGHRMVSHPTRQPRGPPSGADELGPKNFATRIRRKAIGGLGALMDARERRDTVEVY